jgi:S-DNA-T family DNA segregation ATPase FtsK/SpoIIIE
LKIKAKVVNTESNGTISKYYLSLQPGEKVSRIENCATEIALGLKAYSKPIIRVIMEKGLVCVELFVKPLNTVGFFDIAKPQYDSSLPLVLGRTHDGNDLIVDLSTMPHLLIAGTTGSGKSVLLHSILSGLITSNKSIKLALIDPKKVEFSHYSEIQHLMYPVVTDPDNALSLLSDLVDEMENRFKIMSKASVTNISDFNRKKPNKELPHIVLVIDEFSDLMHTSKKIFQKQLCLLAQKSRACGIHIIIATQRPSVDVVTGLIKSNFPARISCRVSSLIDSRVILNCSGAEKLLGKGDALISSVGLNMVRFQGAYISVEEIQNICKDYKRSKISRVINYIRGVQ